VRKRRRPKLLRDADLLGILFGGGLRHSEVVSLDVAEFDRTKGTLRVRGKGNKGRVVLLPEGAR